MNPETDPETDPDMAPDWPRRWAHSPVCVVDDGAVSCYADSHFQVSVNCKDISVMSIIRVTVRTFQSEEHATMFLSLSGSAFELIRSRGLKASCKISQLQAKPHEVVSVWEYDNEAHIKAVRDLLAEMSRFPNSLSPREISYQADVKAALVIEGDVPGAE